MKIAILSDIHGNLEAFKNCVDLIKKRDISSIILLGDLIDYGPHSNEVIELLDSFQMQVICNIWGNHEYSIVNEVYERFSSDRGRASARLSRANLNQSSWDYINKKMSNTGKFEFKIDGKYCLAVHGSLQDEYWKAIKPGDDLAVYEKYDYVFSGHSHLPYIFAEYYKSDNPEYRDRKKTTFINPGSVGQPRNHNPRAQFVIWDTDSDGFDMCSVEYDVLKEQQAFSDEIDSFYRERLTNGI